MPLSPAVPASPVRDALLAARVALGEQYGVQLRHLLLYGSQARGDARDESDVDVLVVLDESFQRYEEVKRLVDVSMDLFNRYGYWVSFKVLSVADYEDPDHPLMINVRKEGIPL